MPAHSKAKPTRKELRSDEREAASDEMDFYTRFCTLELSGNNARAGAYKPDADLSQEEPPKRSRR